MFELVLTYMYIMLNIMTVDGFYSGPSATNWVFRLLPLHHFV